MGSGVACEERELSQWQVKLLSGLNPACGGRKAINAGLSLKLLWGGKALELEE